MSTGHDLVTQKSGYDVDVDTRIVNVGGEPSPSDPRRLVRVPGMFDVFHEHWLRHGRTPRIGCTDPDAAELVGDHRLRRFLYCVNEEWRELVLAAFRMQHQRGSPADWIGESYGRAPR